MSKKNIFFFLNLRSFLHPKAYSICASEAQAKHNTSSYSVSTGKGKCVYNKTSYAMGVVYVMEKLYILINCVITDTTLFQFILVASVFVRACGVCLCVVLIVLFELSGSKVLVFSHSFIPTYIPTHILYSCSLALGI